MANSHLSSRVQLVFSAKNRIKMISEDLQRILWAYLAGTARSYRMHAIAIGGIEDHVHALISLGAALGIAKAAQVLKANSSHWVNENERVRLAWQEGYFACNVSRSQVPSVTK
jgi:REP-associated tyrosine transposase